MWQGDRSLSHPPFLRQNCKQTQKWATSRYKVASDTVEALLWDLFAWFLTDISQCIFRHRGGIRRGPEHRPAHGHVHSSKAARPSLTSNWWTESSVNVALTYKRSTNIYFMISNCDKLFYSLTTSTLESGLRICSYFCFVCFLYIVGYLEKWS